MKTILAYRFSAFGDVAMTVPVCIEFLEQNPDVEIIFISREHFRDVFDGHPRLMFKGISFDDYKGVFGIRKLTRQLIRDFKPDYVADLHDVIRTKMVTSIFKRHRYKVYKIDKGKAEKEVLTDIWNLQKRPLKRTVERYADVFRKMGFPLELSYQYRSRSQNKQGIGFAPFAQHKGKMMPLEKSFELARILAKSQKVYFFGGGEEEDEILRNWESQIPNTFSLSGKLTLKEELQQISELKTMISMDSANMHLASLVGTRCISVWGSTHYFAGFLGYGQSEADVVHVKDLSCRPCSVFGDKPCFRGDYACLNELNIQKIIDKL
ncbi:MAG: glycosyltransferase family 9 protein [Weeksellaceae bacterium]|nr:glycosyltransferase family 9 protein [Weeksellaceae bacterium]